MTEETTPPTSEGTRPIDRAEVQPPREDTETLPGTKPDLPAVALLGPLAHRGSRIRKRIGSTMGPLWGRGWNRVVLAAVLGVVVVLLGTSLVRSGPNLVEVPDLRGRSYVEAGEILRRQGLTTDPVSFAPTQASQAGLVIDTIPAPGSRVESGTNVHIIAGAATPTPTPEPTVTEQVEGKDDKKDEEGKDDGDEEGGGRGNRESRGRDG